MNKQMRRERTKKEFIQASKDIIEKQGIHNLSARKVGEVSGYSYATIYNYFKDINTLLTFVSSDYKQDIYKYITEGPLPKSYTEKLHLYITRYMVYMMMNKSVYTLLCQSDYQEPEEHIIEFEELLRGILHQLDLTISYNASFEFINALVHHTLLEFHTGKRTKKEMTVINNTINLIKEVTKS